MLLTIGNCGNGRSADASLSSNPQVLFFTDLLSSQFPENPAVPERTAGFIYLNYCIAM